ncbi:MAG: hypothetical protein LBK28_02320, partial [Propionibacteriaceae bacterium]|nr:hypothetical protein [Propionibacteriaceae bacterium]
MADDFGANDWLIEDLREKFQNDPASVSESWRAFFGGSPQQPPTATTAAAPPSASATAGATEQPVPAPEQIVPTAGPP